MISDEERREVAHRLRELASEHSAAECCSVAHALGLEYEVHGTIAAFSSDAIARVADLIDPQERTCRITRIGGSAIAAGWYACSDCGIVYPACDEKLAKWALQYCPHCGAKVVS